MWNNVFNVATALMAGVAIGVSAMAITGGGMIIGIFTGLICAIGFLNLMYD